jgi:cephalosporin hydroxylase
MDPLDQFYKEKKERISKQGADPEFEKCALEFITRSVEKKYMYNFSWLGIPIIQYPQDMVAMQELIWEVKPDLIIETGVAHGGSVIFYASMLELLGKGEVLGIDIDIRKHNRDKIEAHPMFKRVKLIEGSSVAPETLEQAKKIAAGKKNIMVVLDSMHTHDHVLKELELYSPFVALNNYLVVFDTIAEDLPDDLFPDRPWSKGNNPKTAVFEFLRTTDAFVIEKEIENKLLITVAPDGFLKRVK